LNRSVFDKTSASIQGAIERQEKLQSGAVKFPGARKEWNNKTAEEHLDVPIETLLDDDHFWGGFNIWPSIREELCKIWHLRCDYDVTIMRDGTITKRDTIYALSYERAEVLARRKWPRQAQESDFINVRKDRNLKMVVIEAPKGTGKDFEIGLAVAMLVREFLIQNRNEFVIPYGLDPLTTISINCMNRSEDQAKKVTFSEVLTKTNIPFFQDYFPPQVNLQEIEDKQRLPGELKFPKRVVVFPGTGTAASGLGYCIGSGVIDEVNFMEKSESAKRSIIGAEGYDAAEEVTHDMLHRHESRFGRIVHGKMVNAGLVFCISSSNTAFDFTKRMEKKAKEDPTIYYSSDYFWEKKPLALSGKTFAFDTNALRIVDPRGAKIQFQEIVDSLPEGLEAE